MSDVLTLGTPEYAQRLTELSTMDLMFAYNREEANYSKDFVLIALLGEAERRDVELASLRAELADAQARILQLERELGEAWQPVGVVTYSTDDATMAIADEEMSIVTDGGDDYKILTWTFPDNVRVCQRRTSSSPSAEGE